eukprot:2282506-Pleurochrysis_carterae.AAC.1
MQFFLAPWSMWSRAPASDAVGGSDFDVDVDSNVKTASPAFIDGMRQAWKKSNLYAKIRGLSGIIHAVTGKS